MATRRIRKTEPELPAKPASGLPPNPPVGVFAKDKHKIWRYRYDAGIYIHHVVGGIPSNPRIIEGYLKGRLLGKDTAKDLVLTQAVEEILQARGITDESNADLSTAVSEVAAKSNLNGFYRLNGPDSQLCEAGRHVKACIKEAVSIAVAGGHLPKNNWGVTGKGLHGYAAEHIVVVEDRIPIFDEQGTPVLKPTDIQQRFTSTWRGTGFTYEEFVVGACVNFTVMTDVDFTQQWPIIWNIAEEQGIGATRSQGYGKFVLVRWDRQP